jgi:hypothetical protein
MDWAYVKRHSMPAFYRQYKDLVYGLQHPILVYVRLLRRDCYSDLAVALPTLEALLEVL